ncbi:MAG: hypothetical protein SFW67_06910 [Myxococcaceae bacterium]|nr:hypothetical protein [Myxococcaceae bacterium]
MTLLLALVLAGTPDAPRLFVLPDPGGSFLSANAAATPQSLLDARKLGEQLRYEEAVVEYQRYLQAPERPFKERSAALFELGFIHLVLGDEGTAQQRAVEALELDPKLSLPPGTPQKQVEFLARSRKAWLARARLEVKDRESSDAASLVRVSVSDPESKVARVLVRFSAKSAGPFSSTEATCDGEVCTAALPSPTGEPSFTAYYFVEALDAGQATIARAGGADSPFQLVVVDTRPWYQSPWVWAIAGVVIVSGAAVGYALAPGPR